MIHLLFFVVLSLPRPPPVQLALVILLEFRRFLVYCLRNDTQHSLIYDVSY